MKLIKIDRATIQKNPNEGRTVSRILGAKTGRFKLRGMPPEWLKKSQKDIYVTQWGTGGTLGVFDTQEAEQILIDAFADTITIEVEQEAIEVHHQPEPKYFYQYENTPIPCLNCGNHTGIKDIIYEEGDGVSYMECPVCGEVDSFEDFEYEKIKNVIQL